MRGLHIHPALRLAAVATMMLALATPSLAQTGQQSGAGAQGNGQAPRGQYSGGAQGETLRSDQCVGGYRWIQRNLDPNRDPAESSIPVRCN